MSALNEVVNLARDCEAIEIPAGRSVTLPKGTDVIITQSLGGTYTLMVPSFGGLFRVSGKDGDAIGKEVQQSEAPVAQASPEDLERKVWEQLKTCYDPEIPVNIVDLGLIYEMRVLPLSESANRVEVKMTLTAQGCGMGASIASDAQYKIMTLPGVREADVQVVWDPPWGPHRISPDGKAVLGIG